MLMATAVEPHFPYEYANPLRDFALQGYLRGDFAYDRDAYFGGPAIVEESTAFNLGKLARLPGVFQLWPLALLWIAGVWWLAGRKQLMMDNQWRRGTVGAIGVLFAVPLIHLGYVALQTPPSNGLLGRYYRELRPNGFPPHIERVDSQLDFGSVGELGGMPGPSRIVWIGTLNVPRTGPYRFAIQADDSGWLTIDGGPVITANPDVATYNAAGAVYLTAGAHRIEAGEYNIFGDAAMRLSWQPPGAPPAIVPSSALTPG
jgi:hypothetical protein